MTVEYDGPEILQKVRDWAKVKVVEEIMNELLLATNKD
jgi:hypothetical protein